MHVMRKDPQSLSRALRCHPLSTVRTLVILFRAYVGSGLHGQGAVSAHVVNADPATGASQLTPDRLRDAGLEHRAWSTDGPDQRCPPAGAMLRRACVPWQGGGDVGATVWDWSMAPRTTLETDASMLLLHILHTVALPSPPKGCSAGLHGPAERGDACEIPLGQARIP